MSTSRQPASQLVINWHVTEACNYACDYCYAKWNVATNRDIVIRNPARTEQLLQQLFTFFRPDNRANPLRSDLSWTGVRLNFAGGEPLLYRRELYRTAERAARIGFDVSIITNASLLTTESIGELAPWISLLGISLDSANQDVNTAIGRVDRRGRALDLDRLSAAVAVARAQNPSLRLKINTVVNSRNHHTDLSSLIQRLRPDKWKVLRMLPVVSDELQVSAKEFDTFVDRHHGFESILCVEDDEAMTESYIMIDPIGRFFQNSKAARSGYVYSASILDVGVESAFSQVAFLPRKFERRYA